MTFNPTETVLILKCAKGHSNDLPVSQVPDDDFECSKDGCSSVVRVRAPEPKKAKKKTKPRRKKSVG